MSDSVRWPAYDTKAQCLADLDRAHGAATAIVLREVFERLTNTTLNGEAAWADGAATLTNTTRWPTYTTKALCLTAIQQAVGGYDAAAFEVAQRLRCTDTTALWNA